MTTLHLRNLISRSPLRRVFLLIPLALCGFALSPAPKAFGVTPAPDGGYAGNNTAEGQNALQSLTSGINNAAIGFRALFLNTSGVNNTATGSQALFSNTTGGANTANGYVALVSNTTGASNTAIGSGALHGNTTASHNTATGYISLYNNTTGSFNTATGDRALYSNTGSFNTATGYQALNSNTIGGLNTASGFQALHNNTTGYGNTANGYQALSGNTTGTYNIAIGYNAGFFVTGSSNICIGMGADGIPGEDYTTRIANIYDSVASDRAVYVNSDDKLGTLASSRRYKEEIKPMNKASEALLGLKPVTFRYKQELDPHHVPMFGLIAEEVEKVNPDLVTRNKKGEVETVRYDAINAMLLNEFLKEHRTVEEQEAAITQLKSTAAKQEATIAEQQKGFESKIAHQQKQIEALTAGLQKVSAQLELGKTAPRTVVNN